MAFCEANVRQPFFIPSKITSWSSVGIARSKPGHERVKAFRMHSRYFWRSKEGCQKFRIFYSDVEN